MTAMATIIDKLTASAATEIDSRITADEMFVTASQSSTRRNRRTGASRTRATPKRMAGTRNDTPKMIANADA